METIKENISNNIANLRKAKGLSQAELGEVLSYSDKAVSKWERCESLPDIDTLVSIAQYFNVDINFLIKKHDNISKEFKEKEIKDLRRRYLIFGVIFISIFLFAILLYCFAWLNHWDNNPYWLAFVYAVPVSSIAYLYFMKGFLDYTKKCIALTVLLWSTLTCIYLTMLIYTMNFWLIFILGIPVQLGIVLYWLFKHFK